RSSDLISATTPTAAASPVVATAPLSTSSPATHPDDETSSAVTYTAPTYTDATSTAPTYTAATPTAVTSAAVTSAAATDASAVREGNARTISSRRQPKSATYTVRRRDTLWSIAGTELGDPLRWPELAHLNPGVVGPAPDFLIRAGSTLDLVPAADHSLGQGLGEGQGLGTEQVVAVRAGDTLTGI